MKKRSNPKIESMKKRSLIVENERKNLHTPKFYINEQEEEIKQPAGDPYEYKKDESGYYFKKRDEENWKKTNNSAVKGVFGDVSSSKQTTTSKKETNVSSDKPKNIKGFQQWVINTKGDKSILGKGGDDGIWGPKTANAWKKYGGEYQNKNKKKEDKYNYLTNSNKYQLDYINNMTAKQDTFRPEFYLDPKIKIDTEVLKMAKNNGIEEKEISEGSWVKKFIKGSMKNLPLHIRSVIYYILGRESEMNEDELTTEEKKFLYSVADNFGIKGGLNYPLWRKLGAEGLPTAITKSGIESETSKLNKSTKDQLGDMFPNLSGQFMYTLGEVDSSNVNKDDNGITIKDNYDMNSFGKDTDSLLDNVSEVFDLWKGGKASLYSLIRATISLRELTGYKGFPVNFNIKGDEAI